MLALTGVSTRLMPRVVATPWEWRGGWVGWAARGSSCDGGCGGAVQPHVGMGGGRGDTRSFGCLPLPTTRRARARAANAYLELLPAWDEAR